jgi:hypothetical protein
MRWLTAMLPVLAVATQAVAQTPSSAFSPGEQATYQVHYLGLPAGSAQITVGSEIQQWGKPVWPIVMLAKTDSLLAVYPLKDRFVSYWDQSAQRSIGNELFAEENHKRRRLRVQLDHAGKSATVLKQKEGQPADQSVQPIDPGAADITAATFAIRNQRLEVGRTFEFPVFTGSKSFVLRATVEAKQPLRLSLGEREVYRVRAQTNFSGSFQSKRDVVAYFTADDAHVPVRIDCEFLLGTVKAELVDYKPGITLADARSGGLRFQ